MGRKALDITGNKYNRFTAISPSGGKNAKGSLLWNFLCDCGNIKIIDSGNLMSGSCLSCGCNRKFFEGKAAFNALYKRYKLRAKERNYSFELSEEQFGLITKQNCYYCNCEPHHKFGTEKSNGKYIYNGVDRFDNSKGYTIENCVPCCGDCNKRKNDSDSTEFLDWIKKIHINIFEYKGNPYYEYREKDE